MAAIHPENRFPVSLYATPSPAHQDVFYTVPRAGHIIAGPAHHIKRDHFPGHELILCLRGRGWTRIAGRTHKVGQGDLVWINCHHPHEHGAVTEEPWEVFWIRAEGPHIRLWLNGVLTADYEEKDPGIATSGVIGLQTHAGALSVVRYKDIAITELPATKGK